MLSEKLLLAFEGETVPERIAERLRTEPLGGFTLFLPLNVRSLAQVRALTSDLQRIARKAGQPPLLIAIDQEGGQLNALGLETTPFAGNMALGAVDDPDLTYRVGQAVGRELAAVGINVNYAPNCDLATNPQNPTSGIRTFGDEPALAARHVAAYVEGIQSARVAATVKHFPGSGESAVDSHHALPIIDHELDRFKEVEFVPFQSGIDAGSRIVMSGHFAVPALTGRTDLPATVTREAMHDLVRQEMGFNGVVVTDAFDMHAISQGDGQIIEAIAAFRAQVDLLLLTRDWTVFERVSDGINLAYSRGLFNQDEIEASIERIRELKAWATQGEQPDLDVIQSAEHLALAQELAERSITCLRNEENLLPLRPEADAEIIVIMPQPIDLTPADTSSYIRPQLADAIQPHHPRVIEELIISHYPTEEEIDEVCKRAKSADILIMGTISLHSNPAQTACAEAILSLEKPTVTIALRTPYDLSALPDAKTHLCSYSILRPSLDALAKVIFGKINPTGKLPVQGGQ